MGKRKGITSGVEKTTKEGKIKSLSAKLTSNTYLSFSLRFLDCHHAVFSFDGREPHYYGQLLRRLQDLSTLQAQELVSNRSKALRAHPIDFTATNVSATSFGVQGWEDIDEFAYQFQVAQSLGRVHGFLIDNVFYVRWIDPDHKLYPGTE